MGTVGLRTINHRQWYAAPFMVFFMTVCIALQAQAAAVRPPNVERLEPNTLFETAADFFNDGPDQNDGVPATKSSDAHLKLAGTPKRVLNDQKAVWTSPARVRARTLKWLIPLGAATAVLVATDSNVASNYVGKNPDRVSASNNLATAGLTAIAAMPIGMYLVGLIDKNNRTREVGLVGTEAGIDAFLFSEVLKLITVRERPYQNYHGDFWSASQPLNSSFPSDHAAVSWAVAAVIGEEYPHILPRLGAYGLATAVSVARITGEKHFPSDVLVGAAGGYLIGRLVYHAHHRH
jgi:membrane-associated phospholipid phosphatase